MEKMERRTTRVYAHCNAERLAREFAESYEQEFIVIEDHDGSVILRSEHYESNDKDAALKLLAEKAGCMWHTEIETKSYQGYCKFDNTLSYQVHGVSDRKCYVNVSTNPVYRTEAEHYERVDRVIKALAEKNISILEGQCEVTVTTRC